MHLNAVLARRAKDGRNVLFVSSRGKLLAIEVDETADPALQQYQRLGQSKGEGGTYNAAVHFLNATAKRKLKFS